MSLQLPSARPQFNGFEAFFSEAIAPYLAEKETARAAAVTNIAILGAAAAVLAAAVALKGPFGESNGQFAILVGGAGLALATWLLDRARADITHGLLQRVATKLGFSYRGSLERPACHDRFRRLKLLPSHNRESWEDQIVGAHAGADFLLCEAHLQYKSSGKNSSTRTVFHGQLLAIEYPKRFLGVTVVQRERGVLNAFWKPGEGFSRVGLSSTVFEKAFEAWSTDQVEARDLLDPLVLERFQELERLFHGKKLRAAFVDGELLVAIETGDRLNIGTMFAPLGGPERVERILKEFDTIFDLIDVLLQRVDRKFDGAFSIEQLKGGPAAAGQDHAAAAPF